ncbi:MAG TPA: ClbS/DfsB family four-helix bundle protein [Ktedonobacterales bacterium]|nr:ClbS/DfsB family four-helix bundle protein [Ktedonobacterales bacterium]
METLLDKSAILHNIETEYKAFEELLAPLDGWQLTTPRVVGEWSIKEVLIHLTAYHKRLLLLLEAAAQETASAQSFARLSEEEIERLSQQFYAASRARPLREVWAAFQATHAQVKQMIEALNEKALQDAQSYGWLQGMPLQRLIACDTYQHYAEHALAIHIWLAKAE